MEKFGTWDRKSVISELIQGRELADELQKQLHPTTTSREACGFLVEKLLSCYDNALELLNCMALLGDGNPPQIAVNNILESPNSIKGSFRSEVSEDQVNKDIYKKRKTLPRWSKQVSVGSGTGFEGQLDDGYNWRKYGQKDILGANHPRAYYRCTHRKTQGCLATKQVQRTDEDPSVFAVFYRGKHSCIQERLKQSKENVNVLRKEEEEEESQRHSQQMMISAETQELDPKEENLINFPHFSFPSTPVEYENVETQFFSSPPFLSPATSESYFSLSPCQVNDYGIGQSLLSSESDFMEIISNPTSATNFPSQDLDFWIDQENFDPHFLDSSDYF